MNRINDILPTNCPNCGGILDNGKCPYCGTSVMLANSVKVMDYGRCDINLHIKKDNTVYILPLTGQIESITRSINVRDLNVDARLERELIFGGPDTVEFTFSGYVKEE